MNQDTLPTTITLIIFIVVSGLFGWLTFSNYNEIYSRTPYAYDKTDGMVESGEDEEPGSKQQYYTQLIKLHSREQTLADKREEIRKVRDELYDLERNVLNTEEDARRMKQQYDWFTVRKEANTRHLAAIQAPEVTFILAGDDAIVGADGDKPGVSIERGDGVTKVTIAGVKEGVGRIKDQSLEQRRKYKEEKDREYNEQLKKLRDEIEQTDQKITEERERFAHMMEDNRITISRRQTVLSKRKEKLEKITARDRIAADVEPDGTVVDVDLDQRLVVISMGSAVNVQRGFRFEVFQITGGRRVHKGWIEVKDTEEEIATCMIVNKTVRLPTCPITGYVASQPEERFSPYVTRGVAGDRTQPLTGPAKIVHWGLTADDPIVRGDLVWNPFFDPARSLRFTVAGEYPIKYTAEGIKVVVERYGARVDEEMTAKTDFLIAQKLADAPVKLARELGVKVFYEFELFRFLGPDL